MKSRIFVGEVVHGRLTPIQRVFRYPVYFYAFDLSELKDLEKSLKGLFGYNKVRPVSLWDKDYLKESGSIRDKIDRVLIKHGVSQPIARIELVTAARFFNYIFNPVSFYYCYDANEKLICVVTEVNNTFGERHLYVLKQLKPNVNATIASECVEKQFHVSPFNDMEGDYDFHFSIENSKQIDIRLNILKDNKKAFISSQVGEALQLTTKNLLKVIFKFPLTAILTTPRILYQAAYLYAVKRLKVFHKPPLSHDHSFQVAPPKLLERIARRIILNYFARFTQGSLCVIDPHGRSRQFGNPNDSLQATLKINDYAFFVRCLIKGDVGFGESFTNAEWQSDQLVNVLRIFIANRDNFDDRRVGWSFIGKLLNRTRHLFLRRNSRAGSRKNIQFHYDLSNEFFRLFLDSSMTYSCAYFESSEDTLEQGQQNKIRKIIEKARLTKDDHVLEIGSGWGELAISAAKLTGCRVTTLTLSQKQFEWVSKRIEKERLSHLVEVKLCDYRDMTGRFDKIISIEMIEAVGEKGLYQFFRQCNRLLKPHGLLVIQVISIPDRRFESYKYDSDWIQRHIFPGSLCPSLTAIMKAQTETSDFFVEELENIGSHYARTLREWRERLNSKLDDVRVLGFNSEFVRAWNYYLSYCEAGFSERFINDLQIVFTKPRNQSLDSKNSIKQPDVDHRAVALRR